jgi:hypothetical protein
MKQRSSATTRNVFTRLPADMRVFAGTMPLALAAAFSVGLVQAHAGSAPSQPAGNLELRTDRLQLRQDEATLASERKQLMRDEQTLRSDTRAGRMAAKSPDAEKIQHDRQTIASVEHAIRTDAPGSRQMKTDEATLAHDRAQLARDRTTLVADARSGRMAAESKDAEAIYQDRQAIEGEKKVLAIDRAHLKADEKR